MGFLGKNCCRQVAYVLICSVATPTSRLQLVKAVANATEGVPLVRRGSSFDTWVRGGEASCVASAARPSAPASLSSLSLLSAPTGSRLRQRQLSTWCASAQIWIAKGVQHLDDLSLAGKHSNKLTKQLAYAERTSTSKQNCAQPTALNLLERTTIMQAHRLAPGRPPSLSQSSSRNSASGPPSHSPASAVRDAASCITNGDLFVLLVIPKNNGWGTRDEPTGPRTCT